MRNLLAVIAIAWCTAAIADDDHDRARDAVARGDILPLDSLLAHVEMRDGERLLDAELEREDGFWIYEIELIGTDGRVRELELDARNGRLIDD